MRARSRTSADANIKRLVQPTIKCAISCACVTAARDKRKICAVAPATRIGVIEALDAATVAAISPAMRAMQPEIAIQRAALAIEVVAT